MKIDADLDANEWGTLFLALGAWCARLEKVGEIPDFYFSLLRKLTDTEYPRGGAKQS
jgi:hypothetical protein